MPNWTHPKYLWHIWHLIKILFCYSRLAWKYFPACFFLYNCWNVDCISFFSIYVTVLFNYSHFMLMVDGTDCCFLSSGYLYHAWESILAIFGRAKQHTVEVGYHLCKSNLTCKDRKINWCCYRLVGSLGSTFVGFEYIIIHSCVCCTLCAWNFLVGFCSLFSRLSCIIFLVFPFPLGWVSDLESVGGGVEYGAQIVIYIVIYIDWIIWWGFW